MKGKKDASGGGSATKEPGAKKPKLDINDPNFWEKVMPFDGYNPKQLSRKLRVKKNDIVYNKES